MLKVTLLVKDGPQARERVLRRLNEWFTTSPNEPPFTPGTLLHYSISELADNVDVTVSTGTLEVSG